MERKSWSQLPYSQCFTFNLLFYAECIRPIWYITHVYKIYTYWYTVSCTVACAFSQVNAEHGVSLLISSLLLLLFLGGIEISSNVKALSLAAFQSLDCSQGRPVLLDSSFVAYWSHVVTLHGDVTRKVTSLATVGQSFWGRKDACGNVPLE